MRRGWEFSNSTNDHRNILLRLTTAHNRMNEILMWTHCKTKKMYSKEITKCEKIQIKIEVFS